MFLAVIFIGYDLMPNIVTNESKIIKLNTKFRSLLENKTLTSKNLTTKQKYLTFFFILGENTTMVITTQATSLNTTIINNTTNELSTYRSYVTSGIISFLATEVISTTTSIVKGRLLLYIF